MRLSGFWYGVAAMFGAAALAGGQALAQSDGGLAGSSWTPVELLGVRVAGTKVAFQFKDGGQASGFAGCNNWFGRYDVSGADIAFQSIGTTRKLCQGYAMELERSVLLVLETAKSYALAGDSLSIKSAEGTVIGRFKKKLEPE